MVQYTTASQNHKEAVSMYYKVYSKDGSFKRTVSKAESKTGLGGDEYLKGVSCIVMQGDKIIIETRSESQAGGGLLDFCSGHIDMEETAEIAVLRELQEELGIPKSLSQEAKRIIEYSAILERRPDPKNWIMTFFLLDIPANTELTLQESEVANVDFMDAKQAVAMVRSDIKCIYPYDEGMKTVLEAVQAKLQ